MNMIVAQLSIWRSGLGFLDKDTQLNSLKRKWIQRLLNPTNALWKELMLYRLKLILDSKQGLALFRQKQILSSNRTRICKNRTMEIFFIQLLNAWLHFTNNDSPIPASTEEILDQPIFLNQYTKLEFCSDNPHFYCIPPRNLSGKFIIIRGLCRFLQPGLISSTTFDERLDFPTANDEIMYKLIMDLIPNDWKHLLRTETFQKSLLKFFNITVLNTTKLLNLFHGQTSSPYSRS